MLECLEVLVKHRSSMFDRYSFPKSFIRGVKVQDILGEPPEKWPRHRQGGHRLGVVLRFDWHTPKRTSPRLERKARVTCLWPPQDDTQTWCQSHMPA